MLYLIVFFAAAILFFFPVQWLSKWIAQKLNDTRAAELTDNDFNVKISWPITFIVLLAVIAIIISFFAPFIFTKTSIIPVLDFTQTGPIGDTIGGLMNPFIALAGVLITGLAFYMQYKANVLQRQLFNEQLATDRQRFQDEIKNSAKQFNDQMNASEEQDKLEQFESQFYEMLRLHKENVNEIEVFGQRKVTTDFAPGFRFDQYVISKRNAFVEFKKELEFILSHYVDQYHGKITKISFNECYRIFFWGIKTLPIKNAPLSEIFDMPDKYSFKEELNKLKNWQFSLSSHPFSPEFDFSIPAFEGHSGILGHYYRHLFHTVKFVAEQSEEMLDYAQKKNYLRVLRAQLSNHEQIMLFYNWLSGYGQAWENDENAFFTEYGIIHNLFYHELYENDFIKQNLDKLRSKKVKHRKSAMFELDENDNQ